MLVARVSSPSPRGSPRRDHRRGGRSVTGGSIVGPESGSRGEANVAALAEGPSVVRVWHTRRPAFRLVRGDTLPTVARAVPFLEKGFRARCPRHEVVPAASAAIPLQRSAELLPTRCSWGDARKRPAWGGADPVAAHPIGWTRQRHCLVLNFDCQSVEVDLLVTVLLSCSCGLRGLFEHVVAGTLGYGSTSHRGARCSWACVRPSLVYGRCTDSHGPLELTEWISA